MISLFTIRVSNSVSLLFALFSRLSIVSIHMIRPHITEWNNGSVCVPVCLEYQLLIRID